MIVIPWHLPAQVCKVVKSNGFEAAASSPSHQPPQFQLWFKIVVRGGGGYGKGYWREHPRRNHLKAVSLDSLGEIMLSVYC